MIPGWQVERARRLGYRTKAYLRLVLALLYSPSVRAVADVIGVSPRTISRWKHGGIPGRSIAYYGERIRQVADNAWSRRLTLERRAYLNDEPPPQVRPVISVRYGGELVYVYCARAPFDQLWQIIKAFKRHRQPLYVGLSYLIRFDQEFAGWWDGTDTVEEDLGKQYRIEDGDSMRTRWSSLQDHDTDLLEDLNKYFYMQDAHIELLAFARMGGASAKQKAKPEKRVALKSRGTNRQAPSRPRRSARPQTRKTKK